VVSFTTGQLYPRYPHDRRLDDPQSLSGSGGGEKIPNPCRESNPHHPARSLVAIPTDIIIIIIIIIIVSSYFLVTEDNLAELHKLVHRNKGGLKIGWTSSINSAHGYIGSVQLSNSCVFDDVICTSLSMRIILNRR
jgi:hypothetical protein